MVEITGIVVEAALTASEVVEYVVGAKPKRKPPAISSFSTGVFVPMPTLANGDNIKEALEALP